MKQPVLFSIFLVGSTLLLFVLNHFAFFQNHDREKGVINFRLSEQTLQHAERRHPDRLKYIFDYDIRYNESGPEICPKGKRVSILYMVHTAPGNEKRRTNIRESYAN